MRTSGDGVVARAPMQGAHRVARHARAGQTWQRLHAAAMLHDTLSNGWLWLVAACIVVFLVWDVR